MSSFELRFIVEGLECPDAAQIERIIENLQDCGCQRPRFDTGERVFAAFINPERTSFSEIRTAVHRAGEQMGKRLLAVVMSL